MASTVYEHETYRQQEVSVLTVESALSDILHWDRWIWENNPFSSNQPFKDDEGFESVDPSITRLFMRSALGRFENLFEAINGSNAANSTRAKVALSAIIICVNSQYSSLYDNSLRMTGAFKNLCQDPDSQEALLEFISAHSNMTLALLNCEKREVDISDAWHNTFAYHGKHPCLMSH